MVAFWEMKIACRKDSEASYNFDEQEDGPLYSAGITD